MKNIVIPYQIVEGEIYICEWFLGRIIRTESKLLEHLIKDKVHFLAMLDVAKYRKDCCHARRVYNMPTLLWILFVRIEPGLWESGAFTLPDGTCNFTDQQLHETPLEMVLVKARQLLPPEYYGDGVFMAGVVVALLTSFSKHIEDPASLPNTSGTFVAGQYLRTFNVSSEKPDKVRVRLEGPKLVRARQFVPLPPELAERPEPKIPNDNAPILLSFIVYYNGRIFASRRHDGCEYDAIRDSCHPDQLFVHAEPDCMFRCRLPESNDLWPLKRGVDIGKFKNCMGHDYFSKKYPSGIRFIWADKDNFTKGAVLRCLLEPTDAKSDEAVIDDCPICLEKASAPVTAPCGHVFCCECLSRWVVEREGCPTCRTPVDRTDMITDYQDWPELGTCIYGTAYDFPMGQGLDMSSSIWSRIFRNFYRWQLEIDQVANWPADETFINSATQERLVTWVHLEPDQQSCLVTLTGDQAAELDVGYRSAIVEDNDKGKRIMVKRRPFTGETAELTFVSRLSNLLAPDP